MRVGALVLAAGTGERMGSPKALLVVHDTALVENHVARFEALGCEPIVVVKRPELAAAASARRVITGMPAIVVTATTRSQAESLHTGIA